tara:strand:- start:47 stop:259 length:213 start_codon:yes stop_codon:yes gene_type:complete
MSKILNINTGKERVIPTFNCTICDCKFTEDEGGLQKGVIGIIPISFCPTCFSGIIHMVNYFTTIDETKGE